MSASTKFKSPYPYGTPKNREFAKPKKIFSDKSSDSEESTVSSKSESDTPSGSSTNSENGLSIVAMFDDLMRAFEKRRNDKEDDLLLKLTLLTKEMHSKLQMSFRECQRLQEMLDLRTHELSDLENKLATARNFVDLERRNTKRAEVEREKMEKHIDLIKELLSKDSKSFPDDTKKKLAFLNYNNYNNANERYSNRLSDIKEINSTGSILSDFSYSKSEDDLDESRPSREKGWKKARPSTGGSPEPAIKKRRSSNRVVEINTNETVRATTTLTVQKEGPITATSVIESVPFTPKANGNGPPANLVFESWAKSPHQRSSNNLRQHVLQTKTIVMPDICGPCEKKIRFGKTALKCKECRTLCHVECKNQLPLPCVPSANTPTQRHNFGTISDYTPTQPPMVPALIVHCINEIEARGLNELGLYRIPGSEKEVKSLKEKFLRGRGSPCLNQVDIHVICGTVKDFLRSLTDSLTTYALRDQFVQAIKARDPADIVPAFYQIISELPQPNRDTLAFLILHLQRVAASKECKMPISNLARVFAPTIVSYSSEDPDPNNILNETQEQFMIMEQLLNLPSEYWSSFLDVEQIQPASRLQQTPSTDSLLRGRNIFTPNSYSISNNKYLSVNRKKQRTFATPPVYK